MIAPRCRRTILLLVLLAMVSSACSANSGSTTPTWSVGVLRCSSDCGFLRMANEKGFFASRGVDVELVKLQSASQALPALAAGEVDAVVQNAGAFFIASQQGDLDASIIGSTMIGLPWAIYARDGITALSDLRNKSMAISSPTGLPAVIAEVMLERAGVPWKSMQVLNAGGNADRYRAVVVGTADAASSPADYTSRASGDSVNVLALASDIVPKYPRYSIIARDDRLAAKPKAARRYLAGLMDGFRYAYHHPGEAKQLAAKMAGTTADDPYITSMQDLITSRRLVDPEAGVHRPKMQFLNRTLTSAGLLNKPVDLDQLVNTGPQQAALAMVQRH